MSTTTSTSSALGREDPVAEEMVRLAESNGDIFFKDTFGQPHAIINTGREVVSMDTKKFAYHLEIFTKT